MTWCRRRPVTSRETPADSKVAISSRIRQAADEQPDRERRAGAFAEPQVEVEHRPQAESVERDRVARLHGAMRRDAAAVAMAGARRAATMPPHR